MFVALWSAAICLLEWRSRNSKVADDQKVKLRNLPIHQTYLQYRCCFTEIFYLWWTTARLLLMAVISMFLWWEGTALWVPVLRKWLSNIQRLVGIYVMHTSQDITCRIRTFYCCRRKLVENNRAESETQAGDLSILNYAWSENGHDHVYIEGPQKRTLLVHCIVMLKYCKLAFETTDTRVDGVKSPPTASWETSRCWSPNDACMDRGPRDISWVDVLITMPYSNYRSMSFPPKATYINGDDSCIINLIKSRLLSAET
jgi:hypothetical protein